MLSINPVNYRYITMRKRNSTGLLSDRDNKVNRLNNRAKVSMSTLE
jgi:hypothetical protein